MDEVAFITLDQKLFERLSHGPLGQITLYLKNGNSIVGDAKGVARGGDADPPGFWGRLLMTVGKQDIEVRYSDIADIS